MTLKLNRIQKLIIAFVLFLIGSGAHIEYETKPIVLPAYAPEDKYDRRDLGLAPLPKIDSSNIFADLKPVDVEWKELQARNARETETYNQHWCHQYLAFGRIYKPIEIFQMLLLGSSLLVLASFIK